MNKVFRTVTIVFVVFFLAVASLLSLTSKNSFSGGSVKTVQDKLNKVNPEGVVVASNDTISKVYTDINILPLTDNLDLYAYDDPASVVTMYLTVRRGNELEDTNHTWAEVNNATKFFFEKEEHVIVPKAEAILQIGDETGPLAGEVGYGSQIANATVQIRGSSTSMEPQKSYKIELFNSAGSWRGQKTIDLNKHIYDISRARNKLSFDLIKTIPNMVSLRTQFVHLYVKDETAAQPQTAFVDYGLFTQVEQPNKTFLKNHLLDCYGQLYKAIMFEFYRYPDQLRSGDDPAYSQEEFEKVLEIKGNKDHTKLLEMLDDVNNWAIPIDQTFEKYFDEDNYYTWLAFNILVGNVDTSAQNFYLYSPQNGEKWYFLPWDYDDTFMRRERIETQVNPYSSREEGITNYWDVVLHQRVLMIPKNREKLDQKIEELMKVLTPERINDMLNVYRTVTEQYVGKMPDVQYLLGTLDLYDHAYSLMPDEIEFNYELYKDSLENPMPYYLDVPEISGDSMEFRWGEAYDFDAEDITYHFMVSKKWDFTDIVEDVTLTNVLHVSIPKLSPGIYFWRVIATNESGKSQIPYDYYEDSDDNYHYGMKYMYISPEGQILEIEKEK